MIDCWFSPCGDSDFIKAMLKALAVAYQDVTLRLIYGLCTKLYLIYDWALIWNSTHLDQI